MEILVCVKQVYDPEAPSSSFQIDSTTNTVKAKAGVPYVISTFDEYAVEAALRIREKVGGHITVLSLGCNLIRDVVKKPVSMGADKLVLLEDESFADTDSLTTATMLAAAIRKLGTYDLILCGRQSADWGAGVAGAGIAELLHLPCISIARKVEIVERTARVEQVLSNGYRVVEAALPAVVTMSNEHAEPRYPTIKGIMTARKKQPVVWSRADLGVPEQNNSEKVNLLKLEEPVRNQQCEFIGGENAGELVENLVNKMREAKIL